jgi:predicted acyl esterase
MLIDWEVSIEMDDGAILRADIFRPPQDGIYPVILTYGPYGKGLAFQDGYADQWEIMTREHPEVAAGTSNGYQNWEVVDPEKWVTQGYACVRVDSRGAGRSPGYLDVFSPRETRDLYECIEWAGIQRWSNGKVGLLGISYYAINQWHVASLQPPHLAAICPWEGAADWYRDMTHHGGIVSTFWSNWYRKQVFTVQHGIGERGFKSRVTGELVAGPESLPEEELAQNRSDLEQEILDHPLDDDYHRERSPIWSEVNVPLLSSANWGGQGLHSRGNLEGFVNAASSHKWLEVHGLEHWTEFYTDYGRELQLKFFDFFLKGEDNGWDEQPRVQLQIRRVDGYERRSENEWPLARTKWTRFHLDPDSGGLSRRPVDKPSARSFDALGAGVTFAAPPLENETEITGPAAARLFISSTTTDADLFLVLRVLAPDGSEVVFQGALDPHTPAGQGWLRASHRRLDPDLSLEYRPYHRHEEVEPLVPGKVYELHVEIWPTSVVVPAGYRLALTIRGSDYEYEGDEPGLRIASFANELRGSGPFLHDDPRDRPSDRFGGTTTVHAGDATDSFLLLPVIPRN